MRTAFVGNLPFEAEDEEVRKVFEQFGEIEYVRLIRDKFTRQGKGIGYVCFKEFKGLKNALKGGEVVFRERALRISKAQEDGARQQGKRREAGEMQRRSKKIAKGKKAEKKGKDRNILNA